MRNPSTPPQVDTRVPLDVAFRVDADEDIGYEAALPYLMADASGEFDGTLQGSAGRGVMN